MEAENKLSLKAGQDIDLASTLHKERNKQGYTQTIASSGKAAVTGNQGTLSMEAEETSACRQPLPPRREI